MTAAVDKNCIFCNPAPDAVVFKSEDGVVIIANPIRAGHVLVGVNSHSPSLHDVNPEEAGAMLRLACRVAKALVEITGAEKTYVVAIGDKDKHFHFHLLPKMESDSPLGPYVFGGEGWASRLPSPADSGELTHVIDELSRSLENG